MGVAAPIGSVSGNRARKEGKRYYWGAERPSVIERRLQKRKEQIPQEIAAIREEAEREVARKIAAKEEELLKIIDQEALLAEHRKDVKRRRLIKSRNSYVVPKGNFTEEQIAEFMAANPGFKEKEARVLLSMRAMESTEDPVSEPMPGKEIDSVPSAANTLKPIVQEVAKPADTPKAISPEKPKPAPVHIEASVTFTAASGEGQRNDLVERDWSDFDHMTWEEGQDYPTHLYHVVSDQDRDYRLEPRADLESSEEPTFSAEIRALRERQRELETIEDGMLEKYGRNRGLWSPELVSKMEGLGQELKAINIELRTQLAG